MNNVQWEALQKTQKRIYQKTTIETKTLPPNPGNELSYSLLKRKDMHRSLAHFHQPPWFGTVNFSFFPLP